MTLSYIGSGLVQGVSRVVGGLWTSEDDESDKKDDRGPIKKDLESKSAHPAELGLPIAATKIENRPENKDHENAVQTYSVPILYSNMSPPSLPQSSARSSPGLGSFPAANSAQRVGGLRAPNTQASGRRVKVALKPGHSALDWANLRSSGKNLRGINYPGLIRVSKEELQKHNKVDDAWTVLAGKVYNITPYVYFHPGGDKEIVRCAGRDGTKLFMSTHNWVNYEHMLDKCLIGFYVP